MKYNSERLYKKSPKIYGDYIYIHKNALSIGRMGNGKAKSDNDLVATFRSQKKRIGLAAKNQYIHFMKESIQPSLGVNKLLESILDEKNNNRDIIMKDIHQVLLEGYEKQFDSKNIEKLLKLNQSIDLKSSTNKTKVEALNKMFQGENNKKGFKFLDQILSVMAEACSLIKGPHGSYFMTALINSMGKNDFRATGTELQRIANDFINNQNGKMLNEVQLTQGLALADTLNKIGNRLKQGVTSKGNLLSADSLRGLLSNSFFPDMAEILAIQLKEVGVNSAVNYVKELARTTGKDPYKLQYTNSKGETDNASFNTSETQLQSYVERASYGKADGLFNVKIDASKTMINSFQGKIEMTVGISSKAYATNQIGGSLTDVNDIYHLGGGFTLGLAFKTMGLSLYNKYLGYNVIARDQAVFPQGLRALQDIILTRSIVYLAAGRSSKDFSQLLLLNGKLVSMWDIILYAVQNDIGASASMDNELSGLYMSIPDRRNIIAYAENKNWKNRIEDTNEAIQKAVIRLSIIPKKILDYTNMKPKI